jgi:hypothetical protein
MADMYAIYRQLSADAAHPSLEALDRYIRENNTIRWGPNCEQKELIETLQFGCHFLIAACGLIKDLTKNEEYGEALAKRMDEYKTLLGVQDGYSCFGDDHGA